MRVELDKNIIKEIVEFLAEQLEIESLGPEEKDVLESIACHSIAIYLSKLNKENEGTGVH